MNKSAEFCGLSWLKEVDERGLLFLFPPGIYISRIFAVADAFLTTDVSALPLYSQLQMLFFRSNVSATCSSLNVQILFNLSVTHNCIYILSFLGGEDTSFVNFASTFYIFYDMRMLSSKIMHPQLAPFRNWGYLLQKLCIFNLRKSTIADIIAQYPLSSLTSWSEPIHDLQKNWYKKFERIWSERWRHLERKFLR